MPTWSTGSRGFTLVELVVVVAVIAVLATMTIPGMTGATGSASLRAPARDLLVAARYARDHAATRCRECRLQIDTGEGRFALAVADDPNRPGEFRALPSVVVKPRVLPGGIRFGRVRVRRLVEDGESGDAITFRPDGRCDAAVVKITDGRRTCSLVIDADTGRPSLVEGTVAEMVDERIDLDG
jgi:type II secretion system protein H